MFIFVYVNNNIIIENDNWRKIRRNWESKYLKKLMIYVMYCIDVNFLLEINSNRINSWVEIYK